MSLSTLMAAIRNPKKPAARKRSATPKPDAPVNLWPGNIAGELDPSRPILRSGAQAPDVRDLAAWLNGHGYDVDATSDIVTSDLLVAVKAVRGTLGIPADPLQDPDNLIGPNVWAAVNAGL